MLPCCGERCSPGSVLRCKGVVTLTLLQDIFPRDAASTLQSLRSYFNFELSLARAISEHLHLSRLRALQTLLIRSVVYFLPAALFHTPLLALAVVRKFASVPATAAKREKPKYSTLTEKEHIIVLKA